MDEALEWVKRCPNPTGADSEVEVRQVFEAEDFGAEFTPGASGTGEAPVGAGRRPGGRQEVAAASLP